MEWERPDETINAELSLGFRQRLETRSKDPVSAIDRPAQPWSEFRRKLIPLALSPR
jgi:hypothetical protein